MDAARAADEETVLLTKPAAPPAAPEGETEHIAVGDDLMVFPTGEGKSNRAHGSKK
jgi:hypothetical protein